jgi:hypothetical protein
MTFRSPRLRGKPRAPGPRFAEHWMGSVSRLPERDPLRNNTLCLENRKSLTGSPFVSLGLFRCPLSIGTVYNSLRLQLTAKSNHTALQAEVLDVWEWGVRPRCMDCSLHRSPRIRCTVSTEKSSICREFRKLLRRSIRHFLRSGETGYGAPAQSNNDGAATSSGRQSSALRDSLARQSSPGSHAMSWWLQIILYPSLRT